MKSFLLLAALAPIFVFADVNKAESIWERKGQMEKCKEYQNEIQSWWPDSDKPDNKLITKENLERAIGILDKVQYPATEDVDFIQTSLKNKFEDTYLKWIGIAGADCPQVRVSLVKALINTTKGSPEQRALIEAKVRSALAANKYPTLLDISVDGLLLEYGVSQGLWKKSVTPTLATDVSKLRADIKQERQKWAKEYNSIFEKSADSMKDGSPESIKKFKSLKDIGKIKTGALEETTTTQKYFRELHSIVSKLN